MRFKWIVFVLLYLAFAGTASGSTSANDSVIKPEIIEEEFLLDPAGELKYEEVKNMAFTDLRSEAENLLAKLNPERVVWVRIKVENKSDEVFEGVIFPNLSSERIYYWEENGSVQKQKVGFLHPKKEDVIFYDRFLLPIRLEPGEIKTYHVRNKDFIRYISWKHLDTYIGTAEQFDVLKEPIGSSKMVNLHVFFNGFLIFQLFYIIFQWYLVRRIEYLYYVLYIATLFAYFWPRHVLYTRSFEGIEVFISHFVANFNDILLLLPVFFYFRFSRHFLDMPVHHPRWNQIIKYFEYLFLLITAMIALTHTLIPNDLPKNALILTCVGIQFVLSLVALRGFYAVKTTLVRFAISAGVIVITAHAAAMSISIFKLYVFYDVAPTAITMVAIIIEIALFNSGLLFKARQLEKDKFRAQSVLLKELKNKQRLQLEYEGVRDKISRDLHDDVGSTLSSVSIYSYAAKDKLAKGDLEKTRELLLSIEKNTLSTLNSMGDLVWAINPRNDSIEKLMERINTFGYNILAVKDCKFEMEIDPEFFNHTLNLEQRRSILLICKEALNNAAKYAHADDICLKIYKTGTKFRAELSDNGVGFNPDEIARGTGLESMQTRAKILSGYFEFKTDQQGTTIIFDID